MAFVADETVWVQHPRHVHRIGFGAVHRLRLKSPAVLATTSLSRPAPETVKKRTCKLARQRKAVATSTLQGSGSRWNI